MPTKFTANVAPYVTNGEFAPYAWPGGYPLYYLTEHSAILCAAHATSEHEFDDETIVAADVNWEDSDLYCEHNHRIESAYAED